MEGKSSRRRWTRGTAGSSGKLTPKMSSIGAGVLLTAVAGERLVHAIVDAFEGLEEGDAGVEGRCGGVGAADGAREGAGGEQSDDHVGQAAQREQEEHRFDCEGHWRSLPKRAIYREESQRLRAGWTTRSGGLRWG